MIKRYQTRTIWRMFQHLKVPTVGGYQHCGQTFVDGQHHTIHHCTPFVTIPQQCAWTATPSQCRDILLLCPSLDGAPELVLVRTSKVSASLSLLKAMFSTSFCTGSVGGHHFILWHFLPGSSPWIYFSSPVRMRLKNALPLWQYWSKWFGHFVYSCIYALANCFGTLLAHTSFRVESVVNDFMGRAMTMVHVRNHFLNRHVII